MAEPRRTIERLETCSSTNDVCARRGREGAPEGLVVVADAQTGGRGRLGRSWFSPPGQNLYFSLLLRPAVAVQALPPLTLVAGAAIAGVLGAALAGTGRRPRLKWPNDVEVDSPEGVPRKLAGILTEMATERDRIRQVVLGIGVNVNQTEFPPELGGRATSLQLLSGRSHDREVLLGQLLDALEPAYQQALADGGAGSLVRWRQLAALPRPCRVTRPARDGEGDSTLTGSALDVDAQGALLLRDQAGRIHRVLSGELVPL